MPEQPTHIWMRHEATGQPSLIPTASREISEKTGWSECDAPDEDPYLGLKDPPAEPVVDEETVGGETSDGPDVVVETGYESMTKPELRELIDRRNDGRDPDDVIDVPASANKAALVEALTQDDAAAATRAAENDPDQNPDQDQEN